MVWRANISVTSYLKSYNNGKYLRADISVSLCVILMLTSCRFVIIRTIIRQTERISVHLQIQTDSYLKVFEKAKYSLDVLKIDIFNKKIQIPTFSFIIGRYFT
uniref:Uncharacterized protein n=1 Tax=Cacopsylla melanoneura TaxID=428564 RepID=A0A8D8WLY5_9HEMI